MSIRKYIPENGTDRPGNVAGRLYGEKKAGKATKFLRYFPAFLRRNAVLLQENLSTICREVAFLPVNRLTTDRNEVFLRIKSASPGRDEFREQGDRAFQGRGPAKEGRNLMFLRRDEPP